MTGLPAAASAQVDAVESSGPPIAAWVSVGLGPGSVQGSTSGAVGGVLRANASVGSFLFTYRGSDVGPFMSSGNGVRDGGVLLGLRTGGRRLFASGALGYAQATPYHDCESCGASGRGGSDAGGLAYDVIMHANYLVPGVAASFSGLVGASRVTYSTFTVGLELGWFGR